MTKKRVAVAMSGGVDSSVAAALLQKEDYDVIGITHQTWPGEKRPFGGCCGLEAIESARSVAAKLGIPYYVLDLRDEFADKVITRFRDEYGHGRTPNPCVLCNQYIRFHIMLDKVLKMGIDCLATGHYARINKSGEGYQLLKAIDPAKDQSYFLYTLGQNELQYLLFPIGKYNKTEVRQMATEMSLPSATRKDSQDICFIQGNYRDFIKECVPLKAGFIVNTEDKVLGKHQGLALYTIGQRHGLGLVSNEPLYVIHLDNATNRVIIGTKDQLLSTTLLAGQLNWISGKTPDKPIEVTAKIRYKALETAAVIIFREDLVEVKFKQPQTAITPGQSVVFYYGEEVLGGGIIEKSLVTDAILS
jgi:tRNA-specific 2-thiouridylase